MFHVDSKWMSTRGGGEGSSSCGRTWTGEGGKKLGSLVDVINNDHSSNNGLKLFFIHNTVNRSNVE